MTNLRDIALCVLLIVALAFGWVLRNQLQETAQLKADLDTVTKAVEQEQRLRDADVKSLSTRLVAAEKARVAGEKRNAETKKALDANPDWAGERVPDAVIDALGM